MTKKEVAVVMAATGMRLRITSELFSYAEEKLGGCVTLFELTNDIEVIEELREKAVPDFIRLCTEATD